MPLNVAPINKPLQGKRKQAGDPADNGPTSPKRAKSERQLFSEAELTHTWRKTRPVGAGLLNLGNTCFANSVLQAITHVPTFAELCLRDRVLPGTGPRPPDLVESLQQHVRKALSLRGGGSAREGALRPTAPFAPNWVRKTLRTLNSQFRFGRQEDAHEYLRCLLDFLHEAHVKAATPAGGEKLPHSTQRTTLIHKVFGGQTRSQIHCIGAKYESSNFEPFLDLSLQVHRAKSLKHALQSYTAKEVLDGENRYRCPLNNKLMRAERRTLIQEPPNILTVHLKRFEFAFCGRKITRHIEFPFDLNLRPYIHPSAPKGDHTYRLVSVIVHRGSSLGSGHYVAYVLSPFGIWHLCDDCNIAKVTSEQVRKQPAYILMYARNAPREWLLPKHASAKSSRPQQREAAVQSSEAREGPIGPVCEGRPGPSTEGAPQASADAAVPVSSPKAAPARDTEARSPAPSSVFEEAGPARATAMAFAPADGATCSGDENRQVANNNGVLGLQLRSGTRVTRAPRNSRVNRSFAANLSLRGKSDRSLRLMKSAQSLRFVQEQRIHCMRSQGLSPSPPHGAEQARASSGRLGEMSAGPHSERHAVRQLSQALGGGAPAADTRVNGRSSARTDSADPAERPADAKPADNGAATEAGPAASALLPEARVTDSTDAGAPQGPSDGLVADAAPAAVGNASQDVQRSTEADESLGDRAAAGAAAAMGPRSAAQSDASEDVTALLYGPGRRQLPGVSTWDDVDRGDAKSLEKHVLRARPKRHVLDDHDEDYDRGRVKKVKGRRKLDGENGVSGGPGSAKFQAAFESNHGSRHGAGRGRNGRGQRNVQGRGKRKPERA